MGNKTQAEALNSTEIVNAATKVASVEPSSIQTMDEKTRAAPSPAKLREKATTEVAGWDFTLPQTAAAVPAAQEAKTNNIKLNTMDSNLMAAAENANKTKNAASNAASVNEQTLFHMDVDIEGMFENEKELPTAILQEKVEELTAFFSGKAWTSVTLSFHQRNGKRFYVKVKFTNGYTSHPIWCAADNALLNAVLSAMRGKVEALAAYQAEEHEVLQTEEYICLDLLKTFMDTRIRRKVGKDFTAKDGTIYRKVVFTVGVNRYIHFCVKASTEVDAMIKSALFGAA